VLCAGDGGQLGVSDAVPGLGGGIANAIIVEAV